MEFRTFNSLEISYGNPGDTIELSEKLKAPANDKSTENSQPRLSQMELMQNKTGSGQFAAAGGLEADVGIKLDSQQEPHHSSTLEKWSTLVASHTVAGKYAEAEDICREILAIETEHLGPNHPSTLVTKGNLASVLCLQGKNEEALALNLEVLKERRILYEDNHPLILYTMREVAGIFVDIGQDSEAEPVYKELLAGQLERYGLGSSEPTTTKQELATVLAKLGKNEEALPLLMESVPELILLLGESHEITLYGKKLISFVLSAIMENEGDRAVKWSPNVRVQSQTQDFNWAQANLLHDLGMCVEAESVYLEMLKQPEVKRMDTLITKSKLAAVRGDLGRVEEALQLYFEVVGETKDRVPAHDEFLLTNKNNAGGLLTLLGRRREAEVLFKEVIKERERHLGPNHPDTVTSKRNLAAVRQPGKRGGYIGMSRNDLDGPTSSFMSTRIVLAAVHPSSSSGGERSTHKWYDAIVSSFKKLWNRVE